MTLHLTDDQIDDLLIGDTEADARIHLESCPDCAARLSAVQVPLASFNAASLAWGERHSATLPLLLRPKPTGLFTGSRLRASIAATTAAVFALALTLPLLHHESATEIAHQAGTTPQQVRPTPPVLASAATPAAVARPQTSEQQQIARDNQLLRAIDRELADSETPSNLLKMAGQQNMNQNSPDATHND